MFTLAPPQMSGSLADWRSPFKDGAFSVQNKHLKDGGGITDGVVLSGSWLEIEIK